MYMKSSRKSNTIIMEYLTVVLLFVQAIVTRAYPSGAPGSACRGLLPRHHNTVPQSSPSPFRIGVSNVQYSPNTPITVSIDSPGGMEFMAFLLQARVKGNDTSVGQFTELPQYTKTLTCFTNGDSVTHSTVRTRSLLQFTWMPPSRNVGDIEIRGTVAQTKSAYWGVLSSGPLTFTSSGTTGSGEAGASATFSFFTSTAIMAFMCTVTAVLRHVITDRE